MAKNKDPIDIIGKIRLFSADTDATPAAVIDAVNGEISISGVRVGDGSAAIPSLSWGFDRDSGFYRISSNLIGLTLGGVVRFVYGVLTMTLKSDTIFGWASGAPTGSLDTRMTRKAANKVGVGGSSGGTINLATAASAKTALSGATVTATALIPAGAYVIGVSVYVDTLITGATSFDVGDGSDADRWGNDIAVAADTVTTLADLVGTGPAVFTSANDVVLTAVGSNFTAGAVTITVHYLDITAGT